MTPEQSALCRRARAMTVQEVIAFAREQSDETRAVILLQIIHELTRELMHGWLRVVPHESSKLRDDLGKAIDLIGAGGRRLNCIFEGHESGRHE